MALERVILHVGPPRTGTTSIQWALAACRHQLLEHGVYYPLTQPESAEGQPSLAWDLLMERGSPVARLSQAYVSWDEALLGAERTEAQSLLVSSEDFSSDAFDRTAILQLRRRLGGLPIDIVFALRDPRRLVPSIWSQSVKWGIGCGEELLSLREAAPLILQRPNVRVLDYLTSLEDFLQPARINLLTVPRKMNRMVLLQRFVEACSMPIGTMAGLLATPDSGDNAALPLGDLLLLLSINQALGRRRAALSSAPDSLANSIEVRMRLLDRLQKREVGERPEPTELPRELRPAVDDLAREIVSWVKARGARVCGDLRDVLNEDDALDDQSNNGVAHALNEADINKAALFYLAETASDLENDRVEAARYLLEVEKAREFWREQATNWETVCLQLTNSWSWRLTKPLRRAGPLQSIFKLRYSVPGHEIPSQED